MQTYTPLIQNITHTKLLICFKYIISLIYVWFNEKRSFISMNNTCKILDDLQREMMLYSGMIIIKTPF